MKQCAIQSDERFECVELFGVPALYTNKRVDKTTLPNDLHCYDLRGSDYDPGRPVTVEPFVFVNYVSSVILKQQLDLGSAGYKRIRGKLNFLGEELTLAEFCENGFAGVSD